MSDAIVARQPIFDLSQKLVGFELLYRHSAGATSAAGASSSVMASTTVVQAVLGIGLDRLSEGERVWLNFTREMVLERAWELLDPSQVVIELLETIEPDEQLVEVLAEGRKRGYHFALDDFVWDPKWIPVLQHVQLVKVDVLGRTPAELKPVVKELMPYRVTLLAERVENADVHEMCRKLGFRLFQGFFFCQPQTMTRRDLRADEVNALLLLDLVRDDRTTTPQIEAAIKRDPGLTLKLLRIVNSAAMGFKGIESIPHALRLIGRTALERWLTLLVVASFAQGGATQRELFKLSLTRARLLEQVSQGEDRAARFLVGMFSLLHVMLQAPMRDLVAKLKLSDAVSLALLDRQGPHGTLLAAVEAYETGDWSRVEALTGYDETVLVQLASHYPDALAWAIEQMGSNGLP
jgi:EAL and modified HD-GYP domain-containing signal transduction protein